MKKESIKSATLTLLVVISLFFTWKMWSLQPAYEEIQNQTFFESIPISEESRDLYEVVKPQQLYFHTTEGNYSTLDSTYLNSLWREMQGWEYSTKSNQFPTLTKDEFHSWIQGEEEEKLELRFYVEIPMPTIQSMIEWNDETNEAIEFDSIFLNVAKENEVQKVYFVSYDKMKIVETSVNNSEASQLVAELYGKREKFQSYFSFENEIMLPENQVRLDTYQYIPEEIDGEKFKNALFSNPRIVKQDVTNTKNRYTDGTRELSVFPNQYLAKYVNPTLRDTNPVAANVLIEQSIVFLNDHGGWTDDYVLFDIHEKDQEINFIMSIQSIPVINSLEDPFGPTMISQRWGQNEIAIYDRPLYQLSLKISSETSTLMSGRKVAELIANDQQMDKNKIKNIYIAYELGGSGSQQYVKVSPFWCIEMKDGTLKKINEVLEKSGGDKNGVE